MRRRFLTRAVVIAVITAAGGCGGRASAPPVGIGPTRSRATPASGTQFARVTDEAGLRFQHEDGSSGRKYFPETMGPGAAFADFTGDGKPDIYLVNGARLPGATPGPPIGDRFFINQGDGTFRDATGTAGLGDTAYGIGCCAGDFDNDGHLDLYVTNLGRNTLYRNQGNGTFRDVTKAAGVGGGGFSSGSAFGDYDGDGDLDLYVCRYVLWTPKTNVACYAMEGSRRVLVHCRPTVYPPARGILYRNDGDGTFADVTRSAGMAVNPGRSLGAVWSDVDGDGDPDLYVANDMSANFLFINQGKGRFIEDALARGAALGEWGRPQAGMGVAAVDYDGDGHFDLACTNFSGEYLALYRNLGEGRFEDVSAQAGLLEATTRFVGFGLGFPDFDADGWPDLFVANGHVTEAAERFYEGVTLAQPNLCLISDRKGGFLPLPNPGAAVTERRVSRGLAFADFDGDGDPDVLVANWRDAPDLLRSDAPAGPGHRRLRLSLEGTRCNRSAIGARVEVRTGDIARVQEVRSGGSYCSQSELPLTFGLGNAERAERVTVRWPGGETETWADLAAGREHRLRQGGGLPRTSRAADGVVHAVLQGTKGEGGAR